MAGDESEIALARAVRRPFEVVLGARRLVVLVGAQEGDVEVVAGEVEVVGVAAEEGDGELGSEHQPHVLEALVAIEVVDAAVVERDHVAAQLLVVGCAFLLDRRHLRLLPFVVRLPREPLGGGVDACGDVGDLDQLVELDLGTAHLVLQRRRVEAVLDEVLLLRREVLDAAMGAVMVGHHQALRRDEARRAAAREPDRGEPRLLEPLGIGSEAVLLRYLGGWEVVVGPHPFVGARGESGKDSKHEHALRFHRAGLLGARCSLRNRALRQGDRDRSYGGETAASSAPKRSISAATSGSCSHSTGKCRCARRYASSWTSRP